ncbi:transposase [Candidatus Uhrbacteria bacterium]|nr:transposase [Candidatus Uhrbacteria bacterium]
MFSDNFVPGEYYHVYNRGVDRRVTFTGNQDFQRFFDGMRVFNTAQDSGESISFFRRCQRSYPVEQQLARISSFSLIPNHFHMLLQEVCEGGISLFMQRQGNSYTKYFNRKEQRTGSLFESTYHVKHIDSQAYLEHITRYIHLNILDLVGIDWKGQGVDDDKKALEFLKRYPWSSCYYYLNDIETPTLDLSLLRGLFSTPQTHTDFMFDYQPTLQPDDLIFPKPVGH